MPTIRFVGRRLGSQVGNSLESASNRIVAVEALALAVAGDRLLTHAEERWLSEVVREGQRVECELVQEPTTTEQELLRAARAARNCLVTCNQRLVMKCAQKYAGGPVDLEDIVQEGNWALLRASEKFDGRKGFRFSTYASTWITAYMAICAAETRSAIRIPVKVYACIDKVASAEQRFHSRHQRKPGLSEVCAESGMSEKEVLRTRALVRVVSLDGGPPDGLRALVDTASTPVESDPGEIVVSRLSALECLELDQELRADFLGVDRSVTES